MTKTQVISVFANILAEKATRLGGRGQDGEV